MRLYRVVSSCSGPGRSQAQISQPPPAVACFSFDRRRIGPRRWTIYQTLVSVSRWDSQAP